MKKKFLEACNDFYKKLYKELKSSNPSENDSNLKQEISLSNGLIRAFLKLQLDLIPDAKKLYGECREHSENLIKNYSEHAERLRRGSNVTKDSLEEFHYYEKVQEIKFVPKAHPDLRYRQS